MDKLRVTGNGPLRGAVRISGRQERGAADPLLLAAGQGAGHLHQRAATERYARTTVRLLNQMGVTAARTETHRVEIDASTLTKPVAEYDLVKTMRASVLVRSAGRALGEARVSLPGGCAIGQRQWTSI